MIDIDDPASSLKYRWCIQGKWKAIFPGPRLGDEKIELYDLSQDPFEKTNKVADFPDQAKQLQKLTDQWWDGSSNK